jgi:TatD DNase family protein
MSKTKTLPVSPVGLIETHCHLDKLKAEPLIELIQKAHDYGVEEIVTICVNPAQFDEVIALSLMSERIVTTQGVHPHEARLWTDEADEHLQRNLAHPKVRAVGEIGLDYYYNHSPRDVQIKVFERQLEIAGQHDLPVVIHSRDACEDMIAILKNAGSTLLKKGVVHSFSSSLALAECALEQDFFLGFNGIITFKNAESVRDAVRLAPIEQILLETDAPYLAPTPFRGRENAPHYLPLVALTLCEIKGLEPHEALPVINQKSREFFSLPN